MPTIYPMVQIATIPAPSPNVILQIDIPIKAKVDSKIIQSVNLPANTPVSVKPLCCDSVPYTTQRFTPELVIKMIKESSGVVPGKPATAADVRAIVPPPSPGGFPK